MHLCNMAPWLASCRRALPCPAPSPHPLQVLPALLAGEGGAGGGSVRALVESKGLIQISDPAALAAIVDSVLEANPKQLQQYREGAPAGAVLLCGGAGMVVRLLGGVVVPNQQQVRRKQDWCG